MKTNIDPVFLELCADCMGDGCFAMWKGSEMMEGVTELCKEEPTTMEFYNPILNSFETLIIPTLRTADSEVLYKLNKNNNYKLITNN